MTAPERIYLDGDAEAGDGYFTRCFETAKPCSEPAIEYIRADRIAELEAENARLKHALVVWDAAHRTGRNEPLVVAFEIGEAALRDVEGGGG